MPGDFAFQLRDAVGVANDVMEKYDAKKGSAWRFQTRAYHLRHALIHILRYLFKRSDRQEHLAHAICRVLMAGQLACEYDDPSVVVHTPSYDFGDDDGAD